VLCNILIVTGLNIIDHGLKFVGTLEEHVDDLGIRYQFSAAYHAENIFHGMGQFLNHCQSHKTSPAFNGVSGPENFVYQILINVGASFFYRQKVSFNVSKMFKRFFDKTLEYFIIFDLHVLGLLQKKLKNKNR